jgi:hypothetical protein
MAAAGSLGVSLTEFQSSWNRAISQPDERIGTSTWVHDHDPEFRGPIAWYAWSAPSLGRWGVLLVLNADESVRSASLAFSPPKARGTTAWYEANVVQAFMEWNLLAGATGGAWTGDQMNEALAAVQPDLTDPSWNWRGIDASTSAAGVRLRILTFDDGDIYFVVRPDNLGPQ